MTRKTKKILWGVVVVMGLALILVTRLYDWISLSLYKRGTSEPIVIKMYYDR